MNNPDRKPSGAGEAIGRAISSYMALMLFSLVALPFIAFGEAKNIRTLTGLGIAIFAIGLFFSRLTLPRVLKLQSEDPTLSFSLALTHTVYSYIGFLCFLPLVGPVLQRLFLNGKPATPVVAEDDPKAHNRVARGD